MMYVDTVDSAKDLSLYLQDVKFTLSEHTEGKLVKTETEEIVVLANYVKYVRFPETKKEVNESDLIFGKDKTSSIVAIEVVDNQVELFIQKDNGDIDVKVVPSCQWVLSPSPIGDKSLWTKLEGNQHYKYERLFNSKQELREFNNQTHKLDTYKLWNDKEAFMIREGYTYFKELKHTDISILSFDIETNGILLNSKSRVLLISNTFRKNGIITRRLFAYNDYETDGDMIEDWCKWVREIDPSIICGHNILGFDIPFIDHVASLHNSRCILGRNDTNWLIAPKESKFRVDGSRDLHYHKVNIYGRNVIDTMFLAYRYDIGRNYESYGLKYIINKECLEKEGRVFYDAGTIKDNFKNEVEWEKIKAYASDDGDDALALYDKFSPTSFYLSNSVPKPFQAITESASGSQINSMMIRAYYQTGHSIPKASETGDFQGAISFGIPNIYSNVLKIDFRALYPSIMLQYGVYDRNKDPHKLFPAIVEYFVKMRDVYRSKYKETNDVYYDNLQNVAKAVANSTYGFLSTRGLNFNSPENAAFITAKGREFLSKSILWATGKNVDHWLKIFEEKTK